MYTIILVVAGFLSVGFLYPVILLEIDHYTRKGTVLFRKRVEPGYSFATVIRHSVHLSPVFEYYSIDANGGIVLTKTRLQDLGWGVPSSFKEHCRFQDNYLIIEEINRPIGFIPFRVSHMTEPCLLLDNGCRRIDLATTVEDGERVDIRTRDVSLLEYLIRGEIDVFPGRKKEKTASCGRLQRTG